VDEAVFVEAGQLFAKCRWSRHQEVLEGVVGLGSGAHHAGASHSQHAHHFRGTIGAFGLVKGVAGQHHRGGSGRVSVVWFAKAGTALPFGVELCAERWSRSRRSDHAADRHRPRRSELLGLRWSDYDDEACTLAVTGKVVRVAGEGLQRVNETKSAAGRRTVPLPQFAVEMLRTRRRLPYLGEQAVIFPSTAGTLRDPNNFGKEWRGARVMLGAPEITTHSFPKTVATLIDDEGLSARIGADHLGHSKVSMTQDRYMTRGRVHPQVADLLDRTVAKSGE
jgi:hypothetical protein